MDKLKVLIVGAGGIARTHMAGYQKLSDFEIVAACDVFEPGLNKFCDDYKIAKRYTSFEEAINDPEINAVDICTRNDTHCAYAVAALERDLNVIVEKPMGRNAKEAQAVVDAAAKSKGICMVAFCTVFSAQTKVVKEFIDDGTFGNLYYCKGTFVRRMGPGRWFRNKEIAGGGAVVDMVSHPVSRLRYLMGFPKPVSVYAMACDGLGPRYLKVSKNDLSTTDVDDFGAAMIRFDNGVVLHLEVSHNQHVETKNETELFGSKAGMKMVGSELKIFTEHNGYIVDMVPGYLANLEKGHDQYAAELAHFADCCLRGAKCLCPAEDGLIVSKIIDAIYESAQTGHEVIIK